MLTDMYPKTSHYNIYKIISYFAYTRCTGNSWTIFWAQLPAVLKSPWYKVCTLLRALCDTPFHSISLPTLHTLSERLFFFWKKHLNQTLPLSRTRHVFHGRNFTADASTWIQTDGSHPWEANYILQSEHICRACSAQVITITAHFNASVKSWISTFPGSLEVVLSPLSRSGRQGDNLHPWKSSPAYVNMHKITLHSFK